MSQCTIGSGLLSGTVLEAIWPASRRKFHIKPHKVPQKTSAIGADSAKSVLRHPTSSSEEGAPKPPTRAAQDRCI